MLTTISFLPKLLGGSLVGSLAPAGGMKAATAQTGGGLNFPVVFENEFGSFVGNFEVFRFAPQRGQVVAIGELTGTVFDSAGEIVGTVKQRLTLPVLGSSSGICQIFHLQLGPLDLTLLGLRVQLNRIVLDITAQQGGGLLGDLLCAIANLLQGSGARGVRLADLLNQLLGLLG